ncbi:putative porin [Halalkalibaculum sp. DA3122]|uniref:putative porin n=1 Tax=Halalkalibaculum sp. DA3122 TaxID=3373607 RepID=UPI003754CE42
MSRQILTYLITLLIFAVTGVSDLQAQVDSLRIDSLPVDSLQIDLAPDIDLENARVNAAVADTTLQDTTSGPPEPAITIVPWKYNQAIDAQMVSNDSLMRWQNWPDWTVKKNRDPGVLSFRLGTVGRSNAIMIDAHEPRHQQLLWEDIPMQNRVSGTVNWNVIPIHKIESIHEQNRGITHTSNFHLKQYYVNKPRSRLIFDESKYDRRALEFWVTQNFTQKTNAELSYWDRRGGGGYSNSSFTGSQIFARVYHQYDNKQFFKLRFLTGSRNLGEPFGYNIPDLQNFAFNRFSATANQSSGRSESGNTTVALSYHRRPADSTLVTERFRAGMFMNNQKRLVRFSEDTTSYTLGSVGAYAHKWMELNPFRVEGLLRYELFTNREREASSLDIGRWSQLTATGNAAFEPVAWGKAVGRASFRQRGQQRDYSIGADMELDFSGRLKLVGGGSRGTRMATLQQLYWSSSGVEGSENLNPEKITELHGSAELRLFSGGSVGGRGQLKQIEDGILLNTDGQFVNIPGYEAVSVTGFMDFENSRFELSGSGTVQQYRNIQLDPAGEIPAFNTTRIWLKGGAYWKGYLFNRATYVKAGLSGMFSPRQYLAEHYDPALDYWQPASTDQPLPWYSRLDVDISARVRSIMFVLRFENVLDDVSQLGYFETAGYPMPPRRFMFGVRAVFNN